jgi:hypothetical protein
MRAELFQNDIFGKVVEAYAHVEKLQKSAYGRVRVFGS